MIKTFKAMQDLKYRDFHVKLIPNIKKENIIGVQTPKLRAYAKQMSPIQQEHFMNQVPHTYFEENQVHIFCIEQIKDFNQCIQAIDAFLPYVDNWATCDMLRPKCLKKDLDRLYKMILIWINSDHEYTIRFAIQLLMLYYLHGDISEILKVVANVHDSRYYVKMMQAWFYATAMIDYMDEIICCHQNHQISDEIILMSIQKALDSKRISVNQKALLRRYRTHIKPNLKVKSL